MKMPPSRSVSIAGASLLVMALASPAPADIVDCTGQVDQPGYKVLLDDIAYHGDADVGAQLVAFMLERLRFRLEADLQRLIVAVDADDVVAPGAETTSTDRVPLKVLRCDGRRPRGEGDFDGDLVDRLRMRDVIVEVWGTVVSVDNGSGGKRLEGLVSYMMPPLRARPGAPGSGFQQVEYVAPQGAEALSLDHLFTGSEDLRAFTAISYGLMAMEARQYDQARRSLCRAWGLLDHGGSPAAAALKAYVKQLSIDTLDRARNDPGYRGLLRFEGIGSCDESD